MIALRLRQAAIALRAGRLDEVYELLGDERVRAHRRGQDLVTAAVDKLMARAREHLAAHRLCQAQLDADKAAKLGGNMLSVAQLRGEIVELMTRQQHRQHRVAAVMAAAEQHVQRGELSLGRNLVADLETSNARQLMNQIATQRDRLDAAINAAQAALARKEYRLAAEQVLVARAISPSDQKVRDLLPSVVSGLATSAQVSLRAGRIDSAILAHRQMEQLDPSGADTAHLERVLRACHQAWQAIAVARPRDAMEHLRRAATILPNASWIDGAIEQLQSLDQALMEVRSGPLAMLEDAIFAEAAPTRPRPTSITPPAPPVPRHAPAPKAPEGQGIPDRFYLQVDGAGTFLVITKPDVRFGPISSSAGSDVPLVTDPSTPQAHIERREDDYFLRCRHGAAINERPVTEKLLTSGDRITLLPRCRLAFALPNPASTTAVVDLTGARHPRGDVKRVILLDRDLILGPGPASHVRTSALAEPAVLQWRQGTLVLVTKQAVEVDGGHLQGGQGLPMNVPVSIGGVAVVVSPV